MNRLFFPGVILFSVNVFIAAGVSVHAAPFVHDSVITDKTVYLFSPGKPFPSIVTSAFPGIASPQTATTLYSPQRPVSFEFIVPGNQDLSHTLALLAYTNTRSEDPEHVFINAVAYWPETDVTIEVLSKISRHTYGLQISCILSGNGADTFLKNNQLALRVGPVSETVASSHPMTRQLFLRGNRVLVPDAQDTIFVKTGQWAGYKGRFWALCVTPVYTGTTVAFAHERNMTVFLPPGASDLSLSVYAGPIDHAALNNVNAALAPLHFANLWFWMRWLCLGFHIFLNGLISLLHSAGAAIIALSFCVNILMRPLVTIAEKWQRKVNEQKSLLAPHLAAIKSSCKGEEQNKQILALHKRHGIHPLFALKSLLSAAIQIPVFIAAYHMLAENIALSNVSFIGIRDLASPDAIIPLPFSLPFFGNTLNFLPLLMTSITLLSSGLSQERSLSPDLLKKQQRNLFCMAGLFLVLFYTFPAGMVLYWTTNNFIALFKTVIPGPANTKK